MARGKKGENGKGKKLTDKQRLFIAEYRANGGDATKAARTVGLAGTPGALQQRGYEYRHHPLVDAEIERLNGAVLAKKGVTGDRVIEEIASLAFANMADYIRVQEDGTAYVDLSNLSREQMAAIAEIQTEEFVEGKEDNKRTIRRVKFKLADKKGSLELLGRHFGLFNDKLQVEDKTQSKIAELAKLPVTELKLLIIAQNAKIAGLLGSEHA